MPEVHSGGTVTLKVSSQPHPSRQAVVGATWCSAVNATDRTSVESTVSDVEVCRRMEATASPSCDRRNEMDSPGRAESGQQYPSIGRVGDTPTHTDPLPGW